VMFLPSFSIPDQDLPFARAVSRGYAIGQAHGAVKLIIDLSGNGGWLNDGDDDDVVVVDSIV
jgi:hypothetical protein